MRTEPTGIGFSLTSVDPLCCTLWETLSQAPHTGVNACKDNPSHYRTTAFRSFEIWTRVTFLG